MPKRQRTIGTTEDAITRAEVALGRRFPSSFREWLLANNGLAINGVSIFPVLDDRDPRKTWDSIVRENRENWAAWLENFEDEDRDFSHLLTFASCGKGDYYCFDYGQPTAGDEVFIVRWSHETGETEARAHSFVEFAESVKAGAYEYD